MGFEPTMQILSLHQAMKNVWGERGRAHCTRRVRVKTKAREPCRYSHTYDFSALLYYIQDILNNVLCDMSLHRDIIYKTMSERVIFKGKTYLRVKKDFLEKIPCILNGGIDKQIPFHRGARVDNFLRLHISGTFAFNIQRSSKKVK